MDYIKIKVTSTLSASRFYRVLVVRKDINLRKLGVAILSSFGAEFEHSFTMEDKELRYNPPEYTDLYLENDVYMIDFTLQDVKFDKNGKFLLEYDPGAAWDFKIKILEEVDEDYEDEAILLEGKGDRIYEDKIKVLYEYLNNPDFKLGKDEEKPWNILGEVSDFDNPIDIDYFNRKIKFDLDWFKEKEF